VTLLLEIGSLKTQMEFSETGHAVQFYLHARNFAQMKAS
jgi:Tfp pilus assembly ATPase PilU